MTGYYIGYEFAVSSRFEDRNGERVEVKQQLHECRWSHRRPDDWHAELSDGERVRVVLYMDGAVGVKQLGGSGKYGWLG